MRLFYSILALVALAFITFSFLRTSEEPVRNIEPVIEITFDTLTVTPQIPDTRVTIERVYLGVPGFIAIRSIDGERMGQIVEISPYLTAGVHTDIVIELGDFYDGVSELVVVVYKDEKDDEVFNDLDQPMRDARGNVIARYVKTGEVVPSVFFTSSEVRAPHLMGGMTMETVRYTNTGYEPETLEVPVGTMVQFVNDSDDEMWVASDEHPAHTDLPTFDQFGTAGKGESYVYTFDQEGDWAYHDHVNPEREGVVRVF